MIKMLQAFDFYPFEIIILYLDLGEIPTVRIIINECKE